MKIHPTELIIRDSFLEKMSLFPDGMVTALNSDGSLIESWWLIFRNNCILMVLRHQINLDRHFGQNSNYFPDDPNPKIKPSVGVYLH